MATLAVEPTPDETGAATAGRWRILVAALLVQVAVSMGATALAVLLPFVKKEFHLSFAQAGLLSNLSFVGTFGAIVLAGWLVDEVGERLVLVFGSILTGAAAIGAAVSPTLLVMLLPVMVMGIGIATSTPAGSTAVRSAFPPRMRGTIMGVRQTGIPLGGFVAALTLPLIALAWGWREALGVAGATGIVVGAACWFAYPRFARPARRPRTADQPTGWRSVLTRDVAVLGTAGFILISGQFCLVTYLITYLVQVRHTSIAFAALVLSLAQVAGAVGRIAWGVISDRVVGGRRTPVLVLAAAMAALGSLGLGLLPNDVAIPVIVLDVALFAMGSLGWNGIQVSLLSELAEPGREGRTLGAGLMFLQPGILLGPFIFGLVVDTTKSFQEAWLLLAAALIVATLVMSQARDAPRSVG
ncbi:MAG: hypothetical protein QOK05_2042 [Chloroflexota bacterium]|nr:hypothetical protein [Chloroflexota bacterium]